jgi:hypothetical protein
VVVKRELVIHIAPDGSVSVEVKGVPGPECTEVSKFLEDSLGEVIQRERTSEYYQEAPRREITTRRGE